MLGRGQIDQRIGIRRQGLDRQPDVLRAGLHLTQHIAHGVTAIALDDIDRIDAVALGLAHPLALAVEDRGVDKDIRKRNIPQVIQPQDDHPGDPQGDDIAPGHQAAAGIVERQTVRAAVLPQGRLTGLDRSGVGVGPAQRAVRPQPARKPGVEYVGVALEAGRLKFPSQRFLCGRLTQTDQQLDLSILGILGILVLGRAPVTARPQQLA